MIFSGHQPNFLPYLGVFYKMYKSDIFVLDDDVQYSRKGLHNKNFIGENGQKGSLIVPVRQEFGDEIRDVKIVYQPEWREKMLKRLTNAYGKTEYFDDVYEMIGRHLMKGYEKLVDLNIALIYEIAGRMDLGCLFVVSGRDVPTDLKKNERNVFQCLELECDTYLSGTGGKEYNDEELYAKNGIEIVYSDYTPLVYKQRRRHGEFIENLSVIDYLFNNGFVIPEEWKS